jgi:hypothetical protein
MNKSIFFSGQPVFSQLLRLIPGKIVQSLVREHDSDRYYKRFRSWDHLVAMLYACFHNCTSLRELTTGLAASYNKLHHLDIRHIPRRSTLSDANGRRPEAFFSGLYHEIYTQYYGRLPDSRPTRKNKNRLFIMDATTITLFSDVMKGVGCYDHNGRRKGGVKAHVLLDARHDVPRLIDITEGSRNDRIFMSRIALQKGDILVFDKGYHSFSQWQQWTEAGINWVTRLTEHEVFEVLKERPLQEAHRQAGVQEDTEIILGAATSPGSIKIKVRLVSYYVTEEDKIYYFLTNNYRFSPVSVAAIYKQRWQVEIFFKRFKQSSPIRYFLGDNPNAIRIQLWCSFIKDLLIKIVKDNLKKKWSFANVYAMVRHHLMNYLNLFDFLNHPSKMEQQAIIAVTKESPQMVLFDP